MENGRKLGRRQYEPIEDTNELVVIEEATELKDETREEEKVGQIAP